MTNIFISYRRDDTTQGWASFIYSRLTRELAFEAFMDVDSLAPGANWQLQINRVLKECDVTLVLIGRLWLSVTDDTGRPRLENPSDVHRLEIAEALRQAWVRVVPVLFEPATMPRADALPEDIRDLATRQACTWHRDESALSQLRKIEDAVRLGRLGSRPEPTAPQRRSRSTSGNMSSGARVPITSDPPVHDTSAGAALSAHVLALVAELRDEVSEPEAQRELTKIQWTLRRPLAGPEPVLGDATRADAALESLDALSYRKDGLRFIRDRVEALRDGGPDLELIELAKWFERCGTAEVDLPADRVSEIERILVAGTPAERLGLRCDATGPEIQSAVEDRIADWRTFEVSPVASPNARRVAAAVVRFYEQLLASGRFVRA